MLTHGCKAMNEVGKNDRSNRESSSEHHGSVRAIRAEDLFQAGERSVVIRHNGREYVLIKTKQGKLLLNRLN